MAYVPGSADRALAKQVEDPEFNIPVPSKNKWQHKMLKGAL
jgi:hypothetical protein